MVYFEDIVEEKLIMSDKKIDFEKVKIFLIELIKKYESKI
jgi:hypothetical protein